MKLILVIFQWIALIIQLRISWYKEKYELILTKVEKRNLTIAYWVCFAIVMIVMFIVLLT